MFFLYIFLWLLFVHWIGDFVFQSHWMSINKSKNWAALTIHVTIYTLLLASAIFGLLRLDGLQHIKLLDAMIFVAINGAAHFITDAITSRISARLWKAERVHDFFVMIGFDQFIHALTIGLTLVWIAT